MSEQNKGLSGLFGKGKGKGKKKDRGRPGSPSNSPPALADGGPQPIDTPSRGQRTREAAIILLEFGSIISEATDVLKPMKVIGSCRVTIG
jgi:hypothetical protein